MAAAAAAAAAVAAAAAAAANRRWASNTCCLLRCSANTLAGNSVSQTCLKSLARCRASSSTSEVSRVTLAAFRRPAGRFRPIFSSFSRNFRPPSLLLARLRTPPRSEALRHSGGERRLWTSPTVTLYLGVELSSERRPGTEQKVSAEVPLARLRRSAERWLWWWWW